MVFILQRIKSYKYIWFGYLFCVCSMLLKLLQILRGPNPDPRIFLYISIQKLNSPTVYILLLSLLLTLNSPTVHILLLSLLLTLNSPTVYILLLSLLLTHLVCSFLQNMFLLLQHYTLLRQTSFTLLKLSSGMFHNFNV